MQEAVHKHSMVTCVTRSLYVGIVWLLFRPTFGATGCHQYVNTKECKLHLGSYGLGYIRLIRLNDYLLQGCKVFGVVCCCCRLIL